MVDSAPNPYVGPRPFERGDRGLFFGREAEERELLSLVVADRIVLLYSPSGAGKSSLLRAGLAPLLEQEEGFEVLPITRIRSAMPDNVLAEAVNAYMLGVLLALQERTNAVDDRATGSPQLSLAQFLAARPRAAVGAGLPAPRALIIDQFEELFTFLPNYWRQRHEFFEQITRALEQDSLLRVVLALREDFLAQLDPYTELLPGALASRFRLERLGGAQALSAIVDPVRTTDRRYAVGVAEKLVADLLRFRMDVGGGRTAEAEGEFVEPVQLQVVCQSLWSGLPSDTETITEEHLQAFGDVDEVLRRFYDRAVRAAARAAHVREDRLRRLIADGFITSVGTRSTVYRTDRSTAEIPNTAIEELENRHLVRAEWRAGARWYELTHDRFIHPIQSSNARFHSNRQRLRRRRGGAVVAAFVPVLALLAVWGTVSSADDSPAPGAPAGSVIAFPVEADVTGQGRVVSSPLGINCPTGCSATFKSGASITATARPNHRSGSRFVRWRGACQGTRKVCRVTVADETSLSALFTSVLGKSVIGRPIEVIQTGNSQAKHRILVIGCTAGDECTGIPIAEALSGKRPPPNAGLWIVPNLNPDGFARRERRNANGVDLNRNFSTAWESASGDPRSENYRGKQPLSEPESRIAKRLVEDVRPSITVWYFARKKPCLVEEGVAHAGGSAAIPRAYSRAIGLDGELLVTAATNPGSAQNWQNQTFPGTTAFFVELPCGTLRRDAVERHASAVLQLPPGS